MMLDELSLVSLPAAASPQVIFERGERTHPASELDQHAPDRRRKMHPRKPAPPENQKPAQYHEQRKSGMHHHDEICGCAKYIS